MKNAFLLLLLISFAITIAEHIMKELAKGNFVPFAVVAIPIGVIFGPGIRKWAKTFAEKKVLPLIPQKYSGKTGLDTLRFAINDEDADKELIEKAVTEFNQIQQLMKRIDDRRLLSEVKELQLSSKRILDYLVSHPERISAASKFINYYQNKTLGILGQYVSLDSVGVETSSENKSLAGELIRTFHGFSEAYRNELRKIAGAELRDIEAEIKLAGHMLRDDGIMPPSREGAATEKAAAVPCGQKNRVEDYAEIDGLVYEMPKIFNGTEGSES